MHPATGSDAREGEVAIDLPARADASVYFIGTIRSPWASRADCPKRGDPFDGPVCRIEVLAEFAPALSGLEDQERVQVLYWMHLARRDLVVTHEGSGLVVPNDRHIAVVGLDDVVVVDTGDAVLVTDRAHAQDVKRIVAALQESGREHLT